MMTALLLLGGAVIVRADPVGAPRPLDTETVWRQGGGRDENVLFAGVVDIVCSQDGTAYVLDQRLNTVHVLASDGRYLKALGRSGEGPSEFRMASGLALLADDVICVTQVVPARAVLLSYAGKAMNDHRLPVDFRGAYLNGCASRNGNLVVHVAQPDYQQSSVALNSSFQVIDPGGRVASTLWHRTLETDLAAVDYDEESDGDPVWALGTDGRLFVSDDWASYRVKVIDDRGVQRVIERDYPHRARDRFEIDRVNELKRRGEISSATKVSKISRDIARLEPRRDGSLWVLSGRGQRDSKPGTVATFDAFNQDGGFRDQVAIRGAFRAGRDAFFLAGDMLCRGLNGGGETIDPDEEDVEIEIVCLRLVERS
jgi:hypothetical protein